ncbi:MAG: hypothetical protein WA843_01605 [Candidatus Saccharimonadales bacterium]
MAAYGEKDTVSNVHIRHQKDLPQTDNEVVFFKRSLAFGDPVIDEDIATKAENGLRAIVKTGKTHRSVTPHEARYYLDALEESRNQPEETAGPKMTFVPSDALPVVELAKRLIEPPETGEEITVHRQITQTA